MRVKKRKNKNRSITFEFRQWFCTKNATKSYIFQSHTKGFAQYSNRALEGACGPILWGLHNVHVLHAQILTLQALNFSLPKGPGKGKTGTCTCAIETSLYHVHFQIGRKFTMHYIELHPVSSHWTISKTQTSTLQTINKQNPIKI